MKISASSGSGVSNPVELTLVGALIANVLVLALPLAAGLLESRNDELYYTLVQEDGVLEWMTFWAFLLAAAGFWVTARQYGKNGQLTPWLTVGLGLACFLIAMEEISWGQRVLGYRPPEYFLRENFQQELNLHNVFSTSIRKLVLKGIILGYGVALPLLALAGPLRRFFARHGPQVPPLALIPVFAVTYWIYEDYPWDFAGEIVELMLGLGFVFSAAAGISVAIPGLAASAARVPAAFAATLALGVASFAYTHFGAVNDPTRIATGQTELRALAGDWLVGGRPISKCGVHKRVFSWVEKYGHAEHLSSGQFAGLEAQGLPEARARYFIDPWNSPVWIRHKCRSGREVAFLYSFGPNRRRDSDDWEIRGDDVGIVLLRRED